MKKNYIKMNSKKTGEKFVDTVTGFFSGLSLIKPVAQAEENLEKQGVVERVKGGFTSLTGMFQNKSFARRMSALGLAGIMAFTGAGCSANSTESTTSSIVEEAAEEPLIPEDSLFRRLLNKSESTTQKEVLGSVGEFLADYNIRFADPIEDTVTLINTKTNKEETLTIRPALTWDEVMSLTLVYNNFSKNELKEILNGGEVDSYTLNNAYKVATLQLMGAHVLETRENQVNIDMILHSKEAKEFYNKYHEIFLRAKETTGEDRLNAVKEFYDELYKDFPITEEIRTRGISHSDPRASIEPYKFSIIPMISASEIMFQNLEVDYTLTQQAIDYMNDIGACNIAEDILEKAELISLTTTANDKYADYAAVRAAMITFLMEENAYVIDDDHRELSFLPAFQEIVNGFLLKPYTYTITSTYTVTDYYTETEETRTSDRDEAVAAAGEDAVREAEEKAQAEIDKENEAAKDAAEKEADEKAEEIQQEENQKREDLEEQVKENEEQYQENINNANNTINNGGTVNENDLGNGTNFDSNHSDSNGNLDSSVKDITTDGSGAASSSDPLPDPNAEEYSTASYSAESYSYSQPAATESAKSSSSESTTSQSPIYEYEEPYTFTSEEEIDLYIESLAAQTTSQETNSYGYRL